MFGNMMGKLQEMKQQMDEIKNRLDTVKVSGEAGSGDVTVTANGNRKITDVKIHEKLLESSRKEELEDLLTVAINRAIEQADRVHEAEMAASARQFLPGI